jgi:hypothetical protein
MPPKAITRTKGRAEDADSARFIEQWQASADEQGLVEVGVVGRLFSACKEVFAITVKWAQQNRHVSVAARTQLRRNYQAFSVWGNDHSVEKGHLDQLLANSSDLRATVLETLHSIGELLSKGRS